MRVSDEELERWAEKRADDAGRLARELLAYRRATSSHDANPEGSGAPLYLSVSNEVYEVAEAKFTESFVVRCPSTPEFDAKRQAKYVFAEAAALVSTFSRHLSPVSTWESRVAFAETFLSAYADGDRQKLLGGYDFTPAVLKLAGMLQHAPTPVSSLEARWFPIDEADRTINHVTEFTQIGLTLKNSDTFWVRDEDGRVYRAAWSEGNNGRDYWWDWEAESPVDPVEFMPHPLDPRFATTEAK